MTETELTGMTFIITKEELSEKGRRLWLDGYPIRESDYIVTKTPYVVPEGKWIMSRWVTPSLDVPAPQTTHFVGGYKGHTTVELERNGRSSFYLYISDVPFGTITWETSDDTSLPTGGIYFESANQVHEGRLGQLVPIPKLRYVREDKPQVHPWAKGRRKHRSHIGWGKVSDLVAATGMSFAEIIERFWPFIDFRHQPWHVKPATIKMVNGKMPASDIKACRHIVIEITKQEVLDGLRSDFETYGNAWIPEGTIKTILRLIALDYEPVTPTHA